MLCNIRRRNTGKPKMYSLVPTNSSSNSDLASDEHWEGDGGRCARCGSYFQSKQERDETPCCTHPGRFDNDGFGMTWRIYSSKWTCCGNREQEAKGCQTWANHVECKETLYALKTIGTHSSSIEVVDSRSEDSQEDVIECFPVDDIVIANKIDKEDQRPGFKQHQFHDGETLPGLALKFGVSVQDIKRANGITGSYLDPGYKTLWIPLDPSSQAPRPPPDSLNARAARLMGMAKSQGHAVTYSEAKFYLEDAGGDVAAAFAAWKEDVEWEAGVARN
mmetsp:Transcript_43340/g.115967  ORF Transcript_43340/g.115967 Transcript_43340/m.115967 type:complete len:276 (+) Transcript_43340:1-828(+)